MKGCRQSRAPEIVMVRRVNYDGVVYALAALTAANAIVFELAVGIASLGDRRGPSLDLA